MTFNPKAYIIKLPSKDGPKDYLPVPPRIEWFRTEYAGKGTLTTDFIEVGGMVLARAFIHMDGVLMATGSATVRSGDGTKWAGREAEKAETAAMGRALANFGLGTLQAGEEFEEGEYLADSPLEPRRQAAAWATADTVEQFIDNAIIKLGLSRSEIQELLQFNLDRLDIWNALYADRGAAGVDLKERFNAAVPASTSAAPGYDKQAVYEAVADLYNAYPHFTRSLAGLAAEGKIIAAMTTDEVVNVIREYKAVQA